MNCPSAEFVFFSRVKCTSCLFSRAVKKPTSPGRSIKCERNDSSTGFAQRYSISSVSTRSQRFLNMSQSVRWYDTNGNNLTHFFAVHRETESQVPSDADLEHPDGKNAETGRFQVCYNLYLTFLPRAIRVHLSQISLSKKGRFNRWWLRCSFVVFS